MAVRPRTYEVGIAGGDLAPAINIAQAGAVARDVGAAAQSIGNSFADYASNHERVQAHITKLEQAQKWADLKATATLDLQEAAQDAMSGGDPTQYEANFHAAVSNLQPKWKEAAGQDGDFIGEQLGLLVRGKMLDVRGVATKERVTSAVGRLGNTLDTLSRAGGRASSDPEREDVIAQADAAINVAVAGGAIRADQADAQRQKFRAGLDEITARRLINENPEAAVKALDSGRFGNLDADRRQSLVEFAGRSAEAAQRQREADVARDAAAEKAATATANAWAAVDLERGLKDGSKGLQDIAAARAAGTLTPAAADELYTTWDSVQKGARTLAENNARVADVMAGRGILDPRSDGDRKAVDAFYRDQVQGMDDPAQQQAFAETLAQKTGILPPTLEGQLNGAMRASPDKRAWAADVIMRLDATAPATVADLPKETQRSARMMADYLMAGLAPGEAAARIDEQMNAPDPVRKLREKVMTEGGQYAPLSLAWEAAKTTSGLRDEQGFFEGGEQGLDDPATPVRADFEQAYRDAFVAHGDDKAARAEAISSVKKRWGVTRADGSARWMRYAPEMVYGGGDPDAATWIGEQLKADAGEGAMIVSDPMTARGMSSNGQPTYGVLVKDAKTGVLNVMRAPDGSVFRWRPDRAAKVKADQEAAVAAAQAGRTQFIQSLGPLTPDAPGAGTPGGMGLVP